VSTGSHQTRASTDQYGSAKIQRATRGRRPTANDWQDVNTDKTGLEQFAHHSDTARLTLTEKRSRHDKFVKMFREIKEASSYQLFACVRGTLADHLTAPLDDETVTTAARLYVDYMDCTNGDEYAAKNATQAYLVTRPGIRQEDDDVTL
jgi:hypothetical protein